MIEDINTGDLYSLMTLYEPLTSFALQPGKLTKSLGGIDESLCSFIVMNSKLDINVRRVLKINNLALAFNELSFSGTGPDGKHDYITGKSNDFLNEQPHRTWRFIIDNPWRIE